MSAPRIALFRLVVSCYSFRVWKALFANLHLNHSTEFAEYHYFKQCHCLIRFGILCKKNPWLKKHCNLRVLDLILYIFLVYILFNFSRNDKDKNCFLIFILINVKFPCVCFSIFQEKYTRIHHYYYSKYTSYLLVGYNTILKCIIFSNFIFKLVECILNDHFKINYNFSNCLEQCVFYKLHFYLFWYFH